MKPIRYFSFKLHLDYLYIAHLIWFINPVVPWIGVWKYWMAHNHWAWRLASVEIFVFNLFLMIYNELRKIWEKFYLQYEYLYLGGLLIMHLSKSTYCLTTVHHFTSYQQWSDSETVTVSWVYFCLAPLVT